MPMVEEYTKTYTSYSGCDIVPSFNGKVIGSCQAISYSISREKSPIYTMGSAEPRSFSRGRRGIAGNIVLTQFDKDELLNAFKEKLNGEKLGIQKYKSEGSRDFLSIEDWDAQMSGYASPNAEPSNGTTGGKVTDLIGKYSPMYADEILPFDVTITMANEYGQASSMTIYGLEFTNEGGGFSMDDIQSTRAYTYVARRISPLRAVTADNDVEISASW